MSLTADDVNFIVYRYLQESGAAGIRVRYLQFDKYSRMVVNLIQVFGTIAPVARIAHFVLDGTCLS
jgi:hypothetical protein